MHVHCLVWYTDDGCGLQKPNAIWWSSCLLLNKTTNSRGLHRLSYSGLADEPPDDLLHISKQEKILCPAVLSGSVDSLG